MANTAFRYKTLKRWTRRRILQLLHFSAENCKDEFLIFLIEMSDGSESIKVRFFIKFFVISTGEQSVIDVGADEYNF
jgi:hypothetical protein